MEPPLYYDLYGFLTNGDDLTDLSRFFLTPGVADPSYQNIGWQLVELTNQLVYGYGTVSPDGTLNAGEYFGSPFIFDDWFGCPGDMRIIIQYTGDPDKPCKKCQSDGSDDS